MSTTYHLADHRPAGWYLALPYMRGNGLRARLPEPVPCDRPPPQFIFSDSVLLLSPVWREVVRGWWDSLSVGGHIILWLPANLCSLKDILGTIHDKIGWYLCEADIIKGHCFVVWQKIPLKRNLSAPWRKMNRHCLVANLNPATASIRAMPILSGLKSAGWIVSFASYEGDPSTLPFANIIDQHIGLCQPIEDKGAQEDFCSAFALRFDLLIDLEKFTEKPKPSTKLFVAPYLHRSLSYART